MGKLGKFGILRKLHDSLHGQRILEKLAVGERINVRSGQPVPSGF